MKKRTESVDDVKRALAEQDGMLRAAYERLEPGQTIVLAAARLETLAAQCHPPSRRSRADVRLEPVDPRSVRC